MDKREYTKLPNFSTDYRKPIDNKDIDLLYEIYHNTFLENLYRDEKLVTTRASELLNIKPFTITSKALNSDIIKEVNKTNPIDIIFGIGSIAKYNSKLNAIFLPMPKAVIKLILDLAGEIDKYILSDSELRLLYPKGSDYILSYLKEYYIKGFIHHELSHWLDDIKHNRHLYKKGLKRIELESKYNHLSNEELNKKQYRRYNINATYMEINAQVHSIVQLKRYHNKIWDELTLYDLFKLDKTLNNIYNNLSREEENLWLDVFLKRLAREGLLGKKMSYRY